MKIYVIRHGQTDWNAAKLIQGRTDIPLNETGREQARTLATVFNATIGMIFSSQLKRALETADIVNGRHNVEVIIDERLIERDFGIFEGKPFSDVDLDALRRWTDDAPTPGGETLRDVVTRVFAFLDEIIANHSDKNVLIVTHGHVMRSIYWYFNGLPQAGEELSSVIGNCEVYSFDV